MRSLIKPILLLSGSQANFMAGGQMPFNMMAFNNPGMNFMNLQRNSMGFNNIAMPNPFQTNQNLFSNNNNKPDEIQNYRNQHWSHYYVCPNPNKLFMLGQIIHPFQYFKSDIDFSLASFATCETKLSDSDNPIASLFAVMQTLQEKEAGIANQVLPIYLSKCKKTEVTDFLLLVRLFSRMDQGTNERDNTNYQQNFFRNQHFIDWFCKAEEYEESKEANENFEVDQEFDMQFSNEALPDGLTCIGVEDGQPPKIVDPINDSELLNDFRESFKKTICALSGDDGAACNIVQDIVCRSGVLENFDQLVVNNNDRRRRKRDISGTKLDEALLKYWEMKVMITVTSGKSLNDAFNKISQVVRAVQKNKHQLKNSLITAGAVMDRIKMKFIEIEKTPEIDSTCFQNKCQNNAICRELPRGYYCDCSTTDNYKGRYCEVANAAKFCALANMEDFTKCAVCEIGYEKNTKTQICDHCSEGYTNVYDEDAEEERCVPVIVDCKKHYHKDSFLNSISGKCELSKYEVDITFISLDESECNPDDMGEITQTELEDYTTKLYQMKDLEYSYEIEDENLSATRFDFSLKILNDPITGKPMIYEGCNDSNTKKTLRFKLATDGMAETEMRKFATQIWNLYQGKSDESTGTFTNYEILDVHATIGGRNVCKNVKIFETKFDSCGFGECYIIGHDEYACDCSKTTFYGEFCQNVKLESCAHQDLNDDACGLYDSQELTINTAIAKGLTTGTHFSEVWVID